ncbi:MAG TPA: hypothetical protein QF694_08245 [Dehalococcoidia bacterium]|nr:hypothetical protein [Dehalococcoidia bacterium]MDP7091033.1 hypothetical protein [Dehalococcoidia bacterium]MDP7262216.1 hypothetical protein [Dehalococcoidia bacterium]MDP7486174.1 hypothetical protein [Dehalococcoidia bacterium]HJP28785.1 hypothetical protein [Dehalococcoidia bacterium]
MPIPPAPTPAHFDQVATAIDRDATVVSYKSLAGRASCCMDVLDIEETARA